MMKKLANTAFIYAIVAMISGVLYREGSKFLEVTEPTTWSFTHTHFFILGMFFFLIVLLIEKNFRIMKDKKFNLFYNIYNIGLVITGGMLWVRGAVDLATDIPTTYDKMVSGISGVGHILLGVGIILFFIILKDKVIEEKSS